MTLVFLILFLCLTGMTAGFLAGLLGIGGGVVLVPALSYIFSFYYETISIMHMAVGTSLAVIVPTGLSSALAHYRHGHVDISLLWRLGAGILIGVAMGTVVSSGLSGDTLKALFSLTITILAALMIIRKQPERRERKPVEGCPDLSRGIGANTTTRPGWQRCGPAGVVIGAISSLIGIGGSTLSVPFMVFHNVSVHKAVGTAAALGLVIAIPASIGYIVMGWSATYDVAYTVGYVNYLAWLCIIPFSICAAPLGARAARTLPVAKLRMVFALFLLFLALRMMYNVVYG